MSINTCAMTGKILEFPLISSKTGLVFEKESILSHIEKTGQCPITGQEMTKDDLVEVKISDNLEIKPRPDFGNIPDILNRVQSEWDTLILENYQTKKLLKEIKEEVSHNLYLHQSANLVICRLIKERDEALKDLNIFKSQIEELKNQEEIENQKEEEFENMGVYEGLVDKINDLFSQLSSSRKKRVISKELATTDKIKSYSVKGSYPLHSTTKPGVTCLDIHPELDDLIITGGMDGKGVLFDSNKESTIFSVDKVHSKKINNARFYPNKDTVGFMLSGADNMATFWLQDDSNNNFNENYRVLQHKNAITSASFHPLGDYCLISSRDHSWSFHNLFKGICLTKQQSSTDKEISRCEFHPDGIIFGTGQSDGLIEMWDLTTQNVVATFEAHKNEINGLSFSENGVYFASSSFKDNVVNLWDLRKSQTFKKIELPENFEIRSLKFDHSGTFLGIAGSSTIIYNMKTWSILAEFDENTDIVTDIKFGKNCNYFATTSLDRNLKVFK